MTRERENQLIAQRSGLHKRMRNLIQRIVEARLRGDRDEQAIAELAELSKQEVDLTRPKFEVAAE